MATTKTQPEPNMDQWIEEQQAAVPIVAALDSRRDAVMANFMADRPTYGPGSTVIPDPNNVSGAHSTVVGAHAASLSVLKSSGDIGDGKYGGAAFTKDQYVVLGDGSKAHYAAAAWAVGPHA